MEKVKQQDSSPELSGISQINPTGRWKEDFNKRFRAKIAVTRAVRLKGNC
jgi:hypothetical protein